MSGAFYALILVVFGSAATTVYLLIRSRRRVQNHLATPSVSENNSGQKALADTANYVELDDCRVHYTRTGSGPPLILLHGLGASNFIWRFVLPVWSQHFTVVAIDIPGFGRSSKAPGIDYGLDAQAGRISAVLSRLEIENATLVGSSMGGTIALWMAHQAPKTFRTVVALAPATTPNLVPSHTRAFRFVLPILARTLNAKTIKMFIGNAVTRQDLITPEVIQSYLEPYQDRGEAVKTFYLALTLLRDRRLPTALEGLPSRVLLLWGEKEKVVPRHCMTELIQYLPNVVFRTHPSAGHHIMEDEPGWVTAEVFKFLDVKVPALEEILARFPHGSKS